MKQPLHSTCVSSSRLAGFTLDEGYAVSYAYDMFGRFHSVSSSVQSVRSMRPRSGKSVAAYTYLPNTIVCDGKGGIRLQVQDLDDPLKQKCVKPCIIEHEECHKQAALKENPNVCKGQPEGVQVGLSDWGAFYAEEVACHNTELACYERMAKDPECTCLPDAVKNAAKWRDYYERERKKWEERQKECQE